MSAFTGTLCLLEVIPGKRWRIFDTLVWEVGSEGSGVRIEIPAGFETDGATIPAALRLVLAVWGSYGRAAALHDYLYSIIREGRLWNGAGEPHPAFAAWDAASFDAGTGWQASARRWADQQFYEAMLACGTSRPLALIMWAAVRALGGWAIERDRAKA